MGIFGCLLSPSLWSRTTPSSQQSLVAACNFRVDDLAQPILLYLCCMLQNGLVLYDDIHGRAIPGIEQFKDVVAVDKESGRSPSWRSGPFRSWQLSLEWVAMPARWCFRTWKRKFGLGGPLSSRYARPVERQSQSSFSRPGLGWALQGMRGSSGPVHIWHIRQIAGNGAFCVPHHVSERSSSGSGFLWRILPTGGYL